MRSFFFFFAIRPYGPLLARDGTLFCELPGPRGLLLCARSTPSSHTPFLASLFGCTAPPYLSLPLAFHARGTRFVGPPQLETRGVVVTVTGQKKKQPFFHACLVAYVCGLGATVAVMFYFEAAQPALFYLVPACLGAACGTALCRKGVVVIRSWLVQGGEHVKRRPPLLRKEHTVVIYPNTF